MQLDNGVSLWSQIRHISTFVRNCFTSVIPVNPLRFRAQYVASLNLSSPGERYDITCPAVIN